MHTETVDDLPQDDLPGAVHLPQVLHGPVQDRQIRQIRRDRVLRRARDALREIERRRTDEQRRASEDDHRRQLASWAADDGNSTANEAAMAEAAG